jgi:hypothetical protein
MAMVRSEGNMSLQNPVTPPGIDPGTVRLVAQCLNHYASLGLDGRIILKSCLMEYTGACEINLATDIYSAVTWSWWKCTEFFPRLSLASITPNIFQYYYTYGWTIRQENRLFVICVYFIRTHVSNIFNKAQYLHFSGNYISLLFLFLKTVWLKVQVFW